MKKGPDFKKVRRKGKDVMVDMAIFRWRNREKLRRIVEDSKEIEENITKTFQPEEKPKETEISTDLWELFK